MACVWVSIQKAHSGFGMYQAGARDGEPWAWASDMLHEIAQRGNIYELGESELPEGAEDIRGRITNQPARVFLLESRGDLEYFGIEEIEEGRGIDVRSTQQTYS